MTTGNDLFKMKHALNMLMNAKNIGKGRYVPTSRIYQYVKKCHSDAIKEGWTEEKRKKHSVIIVHGSSYGGTVAARLAMDYPELVDGVLLQSASLKPGAETTFDISYPTNHWSLAWLVPGSLRTANAEKLSHRQQLNDMAKGWERIRANCIILHGKADRLIFPENATYAFDKLRNAASANLTFIPNSKHDLLYTQNPLLVRSLIRLVDCCMLSNGSVLAKR